MGLGKTLMTEVKSYLVRQKMKEIVTFADNTAITFFEKNGFEILEESEALRYTS